MSTLSPSPSLDAVAVPSRQLDRLVSLDVFRGITIAGMILVTDPGTYSAIYWPLRHAEWMGATPTDIIFPAFLFMVGMSVPFAVATRIARGENRAKLAWHALRRSLILIVLGLAVNGFPDYDWGNLRLPGILQRIAICYLICSLLYIFSGRENDSDTALSAPRSMWMFGAISIVILAMYWAMLKLVPFAGISAGHLDTLNNLPALIDRAVIGTRHMWAWGLTPGVGVTYDPEGILSTLPAIANTLIGLMAGQWMRTAAPGKRKALYLALAGAVLLLASWILSPMLPINKRIWTTTFALLSSGASMLIFAAFYAIVDLRRSRWWTAPLLVLGTNAILAFAVSSVITTLNDRIHVATVAGVPQTIHQWGNAWFAWWLSPINASLAYAIMIVLLNIALLAPLYRRRIFLRV